MKIPWDVVALGVVGNVSIVVTGAEDIFVVLVVDVMVVVRSTSSSSVKDEDHKNMTIFHNNKL